MKKYAATTVQLAAAIGAILLVNSSTKSWVTARKGAEKGQSVHTFAQEGALQFKDASSSLRSYLLDPTMKTEWEHQSKAGLASVQAFKSAKAASGNAALNTLIDEWVEIYEKSEPLRTELSGMLGQNHFKDAQKYFFATYIPASQKLDELAEKIRTQAGMEAKLQAELQGSATQAGTRKLVFSLASLLLGATFAGLLIHSSKPAAKVRTEERERQTETKTEAQPQATGTTNPNGGLAELAARMKVISFNASIESARAGLEGRGFSVVAEEIIRVSQEIQALSTGAPIRLSPIQMTEFKAEPQPEVPPQLKVVPPAGPTPPPFKGPKKTQDIDELNWKVG